MKILELHTASPLGKAEVEGVTVIISGVTPGFPSLDEARSFYTAEAIALAMALTDSLPQGTLDRLLIALMERCASLYSGKAGS